MNKRSIISVDDAGRILEGLTTAVILLDQDYRLLYINPAGETMLAHSFSRIVGLKLDELIKNIDQQDDHLQRALKNKHPYTERELLLELIAGERLTVDWTVTPLVEPNRDTVLLLEITQIDRHIQISREENLLVQQDAARELLRGVAHEVKNPLGGLRGAAQLLEMELTNDELKEYTQIIIGEADRLRNLVDRMLGPNRLPERSQVNIHQILEHVRSLVLAEGRKHLELKRDYDPSIPEFFAAPELLIQAILNVVRNAAQAIDATGKKGCITLKTRTQRQFTIGHKCHKLVVRIDIIDNGPGIPDEIIEKVFYPMITGRAEGTGLGLSISQSLIHLHGGLIECESEPGNTVFKIQIPLESEDE